MKKITTILTNLKIFFISFHFKKIQFHTDFGPFWAYLPAFQVIEHMILINFVKETQNVVLEITKQLFKSIYQNTNCKKQQNAFLTFLSYNAFSEGNAQPPNAPDLLKLKLLLAKAETAIGPSKEKILTFWPLVKTFSQNIFRLT